MYLFLVFSLLFGSTCLTADLPSLAKGLQPMQAQWATVVYSTYPEGSVEAIVFVDRRPQENGAVTEVPMKRLTYFPSGILQSESDLAATTLDAIVLHGVSICYYETGAIQSITDYYNGQKAGIHRTFYPNEHIQQEQEYTAGKLDGAAAYFDEEGNLLQIGYFQDAIPIG